MAALNDLSDLINRATGGNSGTPETIAYSKTNRIAGAAAPSTTQAKMYSLWTYDGNPGAAAAPGAVAAPTNATNGGLKQTDPGGGRQKWLTGWGWTGASPGTLILYDRLLHISGLSGTSVAAQSVGGSLTRYTGGTGNFMMYEIYTIIGTTARTITATYTDEGGNSSTSAATAIGGTGDREVSRAQFMSLASGDKGVQGVTDVTLSASTGTAGDFGVTVGHVLGMLTIGDAGFGAYHDFTGNPGTPEILTDACLAWLWVAGESSANATSMGMVSFVEA